MLTLIAYLLDYFYGNSGMSAWIYVWTTMTDTWFAMLLLSRSH